MAGTHVTRHLVRPSALIAALLAAALLMGASPSPSPTGPGPIEPPAPGSLIPVPTGPLFPLPSIDPLDQPSGAGAGIPMPSDIVGTWSYTTSGTLGYVDPNSGSYGSADSKGMAYTFYPDGKWQSGFLMTSQLYGCQMRTLVFKEGLLAATDEATHLLTLDTAIAQMHSEDSCVADYNYDKDLSPDDETLIWERTTDEYGDALLLRRPDTDWTVFRPVQ